MDKLHLVGFTADLKNLVLAKRKGAKSGGFLVEIDARLRTALEEIDKIDEDQTAKSREAEAKAAGQASELTPKEIQNHLRRGKSVDEVAGMANTSPSWIERFNAPILAERAGVVDAVRRSRVTKARLGPSDFSVGQSIESNLKDKGVAVTPELLSEGWAAVKRNEHWEVSFTYTSRGQKRIARFSYDPDVRRIASANQVANQIAWRSLDDESASSRKPSSAARSKPQSRKRSKKGPAKRKPAGRKPAKRKATKGRSRRKR
jgi:hypothetical protein